MALPQLRGPALAQDPASDEAVVEEVLDGESARFEVLMRRHNQRLFRTARAILKDDAEAEDAVQQSYLTAYAKLGQFQGRARFSTCGAVASAGASTTSSWPPSPTRMRSPRPRAPRSSWPETESCARCSRRRSTRCPRATAWSS